MATMPRKAKCRHHGMIMATFSKPVGCTLALGIEKHDSALLLLQAPPRAAGSPKNGLTAKRCTE